MRVKKEPSSEKKKTTEREKPEKMVEEREKPERIVEEKEKPEKEVERKEREKPKKVVEWKESKYTKPLGIVADEAYTELAPSGLNILDLMVKYVTMANPNVMLSEENKILAPFTLFGLLTGLNDLAESDPKQAAALEMVLKSNTLKDNKPGVFSEVYVKRQSFNYDILKTDDKERLFKLIDKYLV